MAVGCALVLGVAAGTRALTWTWTGSGTLAQGANFTLRFVSFASAPASHNQVVIGHGATQSGGGIGTTLTRATGSVAAGLVTGHIGSYDSDQDAVGAPSGSGQTVLIDNQTFNFDSADLFEETTPNAAQTTVTGEGAFPGMAVVSLRDTAGAGGQFLGDTTQDVDDFPCSGDRALLSQFTATEDGDVIGWQAYFGATSTAGCNVKFLLFDDNAGAPGNLIASSYEVAVPAGGGLVSGPLYGTISNGVPYWLGIVADSFQARLSELISTGSYVRREGVSFTSPPLTWPGTDASGAIQFNVAVEYTVAAPGATYPPFRSFAGAVRVH